METLRLRVYLTLTSLHCKSLRSHLRMENVKIVTDSSLSDVKSSPSEKKKKKKKKKPKKQRMEPDIQSENAEKEACLETDSFREDVDLGTVKKKMKFSSCIDEKRSDSFVLSEASSLTKDALSERDSSVRTPEALLHEQSALSETKRKSKKKSKMAKSGELENLKDGEENSLIAEKKVTDSPLNSKMSVSLESGLEMKKGESSGLGNLKNCSLESPLKESRLNEQSTGSDTKQKRKKKKKSKVSIFGEFDSLNGESILELNDNEGNSLLDEKKARDSHLESKTEDFSLVSGFEGAQLNEQSERRRKKGKGKKTRLSIVEDEDISTKNNGKDSNEAENNNMHSEPIINGKDLRAEDLMSVSEAVDSQNVKKVILTTDKQSDSPITASTDLVETQNPHVGGDRETLEIEKKAKPHHKKRKKSSNLLGDGSEHIQTSVDHLDKEHTIVSENGSIGVSVGQAMPVQVSGNSISTESDPKERKRKKQKKLKESLCNNEGIETKAEEVIPSPLNLAVTKDNVTLTGYVSPSNLSVAKDDVTLTAKVSEVALGNSTGIESDLEGRKRKKRRKSKESLCKDGDQKNVEIETKMEEVIPSPLNFAVTKDNVTLAANPFPLSLAVATDEVTLTAKVSEVALGNSTGTESDPKERKRKKQKKSKRSLCKDEDQKDVKIETKMEEVIPSPLNAVAKDAVTLTANVSTSNLAVANDDATLRANDKESNFTRPLTSFQRKWISHPTKKLLVLDLNGILVDVVQMPCKLKPHARLNGKGVFRRPFYDEFLDFCFRTFNVGIWSSRVHHNVIGVLNLLMDKKRRRELVFCYGRKLCTITQFKTLENEDKPLVLKELGKLWDKKLPNIPWKKGVYNESNTFLLDDSPYKALRNPANTAIFPYPYQYTDAADCSLAPGGDLRMYLERLAEAENVQKFIEQNPFGQPAITEADPHWDFYSQIIEDKTLQAR
ncbi:hypothetical protein V6N12_068252 [Hibiscus sabdariffa]|uniref:FCP1 homology domain-containing protein n=1 Tax=Hibiscus sabdariffa TaxID=183260 RepID=A0ABR2FPX1_9ROSI